MAFGNRAGNARSPSQSTTLSPSSTGKEKESRRQFNQTPVSPAFTKPKQATMTPAKEQQGFRGVPDEVVAQTVCRRSVQQKTHGILEQDFFSV